MTGQSRIPRDRVYIETHAVYLTVYSHRYQLVGATEWTIRVALFDIAAIDVGKKIVDPASEQTPKCWKECRCAQ